MNVTAIHPRKRQPELLDVFVDDSLRTTLHREIVLRAGLHVGDPVDEEGIVELEREDLLWRARDSALTLLSFRARTVTELARRLQEKQFPAEVVNACVEELVEKGLVDDSSFAEAFVRDRVRLRPRGPRRLIQELRAKGVDPETASDVIDGVLRDHETSELELAREAAARWPRRPGEDTLRARRRLAGFLTRRGFSSDVVRGVLDETLR